MSLLKKIEKFLKSAKKPLIVVLGPTASGKTALSLKIAEKFHGEIISADSRQIYKKIPIATDLISKKDQKGIPHHLLNFVSPDKTLTLAEYKQLALGKIEEVYNRKHLPLIVGGTGLYLSAIIENYHIPKIPPNEAIRKKLTLEAQKKGKEYLYKKLARLDPKAAKSIHPNNLPYVIRALEINLETGSNKIDIKQKSPFNSFLIGVNWPREILYQRINARIDLQLGRGLVDEVKKLLMDGHKHNLPALSSLGIKELIPYIEGKMSLERCVEIIKQNTRHYAKRQMTWFRRHNDVNWISPEELAQF